MSWRGPILIIIMLVAGVMALAGNLDRAGHYTLKAEFADASGLRTGYFVKIDGVDVGHVARVSVSPRDTALVTMNIDRSALPIVGTARATIRPSSFFGEHYVELSAGNSGRPLPSGSRIPMARTATATELDQLLDVLDPKTRTALAVFLNESGRALVGRGGDLATTLSLLPHTLQDARELVGNLGADNRALGELIDNSGEIVAAIARHRGELGRLVETADAAVQGFATRHAELTATLQRAPAPVRRLRTTLRALRAASGQLGPAARGLQATAGPLRRVLKALPQFAAAARPALDTARETAPLLTELGVRATPVVSDLESPTARLNRFSHTLAPVSRGLDVSIKDLLAYWEGYARAMQGRDPAGHIYRPAQTWANLNSTASLFGRLLAAEGGTREQRRASTRASGHHQAPAANAPAPATTQPRPQPTSASDGPSAPLGSVPAQTRSEPLLQILDYLIGP